MYELAFQKFTLSNGLQVVLHEDHALPTVGVNLWYHGRTAILRLHSLGAVATIKRFWD